MIIQASVSLLFSMISKWIYGSLFRIGDMGTHEPSRLFFSSNKRVRHGAGESIIFSAVCCCTPLGSSASHSHFAAKSCTEFDPQAHCVQQCCCTDRRQKPENDNCKFIIVEFVQKIYILLSFIDFQMDYMARALCPYGL